MYLVFGFYKLLSHQYLFVIHWIDQGLTSRSVLNRCLLTKLDTCWNRWGAWHSKAVRYRRPWLITNKGFEFLHTNKYFSTISIPTICPQSTKHPTLSGFFIRLQNWRHICSQRQNSRKIEQIHRHFEVFFSFQNC